MEVALSYREILTVRGEADVLRLKHLARAYRDTERALLTGETPMARTTTTREIRVKVYDGPHHGRILLIPANSKVVTLPNPMPAGEMWGPGRSDPSEFTGREYTYSLRQPRNGGEPYLAYVSETRPSFKIPPAPKPVVKLSGEVSDLMQRVTDLAYNVGVGSNGTRSERVRMLHGAERKLAEYISKLETRVYPPVYQGRTHTFE